MKILKLIPRLLITLCLFCLLLYSIASQTYFASSFDRSKQAVARWPWFSSPHLNFSLSLFQNGSKQASEELEIAKHALFAKEEEINKIQDIVNLPEKIDEQINYWQSFENKGIQLPEANLRLSQLFWAKYDMGTAKKYWQKAFYLDPNNREVEELGKIINQ